MDSCKKDGKLVFGIQHKSDGGVYLVVPGTAAKTKKGDYLTELSRREKLDLAAMLMHGEAGKPDALQKKADAAQRKREFGGLYGRHTS